MSIGILLSQEEKKCFGVGLVGLNWRFEGEREIGRFGEFGIFIYFLFKNYPPS